MAFYKEVKHLIRIEFQREWKTKTGIVSILMQIISAIFICYLSFEFIPHAAQNPLLWLLIFFTTVQGIAKGFMEEKRGTKIYLNQLVHPTSIIVSKLLYNLLLMLCLALLTIAFYLFFLELKPESLGLYIASILLSVAGISSVFTMVSALAANANKPGLLVPIISLPLILPVILVGIEATDKAMLYAETSNIYKDWLVLFALFVLISGLSIILFRYLRKE